MRSAWIGVIIGEGSLVRVKLTSNAVTREYLVNGLVYPDPTPIQIHPSSKKIAQIQNLSHLQFLTDLLPAHSSSPPPDPPRIPGPVNPTLDPFAHQPRLADLAILHPATPTPKTSHKPNQVENQPRYSRKTRKKEEKFGSVFT